MGKVKRLRKRLHTAAAKSKNKDTKKKIISTRDGTGDEEMMDDSLLMPPPTADPTAGVPRGESLFQNINISSLDLMKQKLPDFDARSSITSKTFKGQNLKKKDKQKMRHEAWMTKIDALQSTKKKERERKRKQKTPVVGDLTPMEDALPTLELLLKKSTGEMAKTQTAERPRSIPKEKKRKKQMLDDISLFHKVVQHPVFQEDAGVTIKEHLRQKLQMEAEREKAAL